jgi:hypothetical protein
MTPEPGRFVVEFDERGCHDLKSIGQWELPLAALPPLPTLW